ncbi:large extracellular alpha-helical protein [Microbacterium protaetiae]|uniref:Large extracellular alpha-helical protein n=1 Tax=Microbacterium protaetiae TaxID=2509458 RepID=A0A4P6ERT7_9MICO|nr:DUF5719 family protein [Microbacterium protaetiae]QAY60638.1 large extracellular alpha-helical protein [Microbacterium protaetiae]
MTRISLAARLIAGAVIAVGTGAAVTGGIAFGWMPQQATPVSQKVAPAAADSVLTCPGPLLAIGRDSSAASQISIASDGALTLTGEGTKKSTLKATGIDGDAGPVRLITSASGRTTPEAAGAASATVAADDLGGFSAAPCTSALMDSWLVGGSTATGAADLITLANPGDVTASVDLTVYGKDGVAAAAAGKNIVVAAGTELVIPLAGLGIGDDAPVVRVTATGAPVRAMLQSSLARGLQTGGVDQSGVVTAASTRQVITGVHVIREQQDDPTTVVRLLAPDDDTTAQVTVIGEHGTTGPGQEVPLTAGTPAQLQLPLAAGNYSIVVTAEQSVVSAVWQATGTAAGDDFAWVVPAPALAAGQPGTLVSVPKGAGPELDLLSDGDAAKVTLTPVNGGNAQTVTVDSAQASSVAVQPGTSYRITTDGPVHAAVAFVGDKALASYPVWPGAAGSAPVTVYR